MNYRQLDPEESANLSLMNSAGLDSALLFVTETGLNKSILDATEPMRRFFCKHGVHDYYSQDKGPEHKVISEITIHSGGQRTAPISFYRPKTKDGDPRFWVSMLNRHVKPDDVCAIFFHNNRLHLVNLSAGSLSTEAESPAGYLHEPAAAYPRYELASILQSAGHSLNTAAIELLGMLKDIARRGPLVSECEGDTAIGRTLETALGIQINSDKKPDYKGIEIKSGRAQILGRQTRATLFACVPNWKLSSLKSSTEVLDKYGYQRGSDFKLYCTVSCSRPNSQGLQLKIGSPEEILQEIDYRDNSMVCMWELRHLHDRLLQKHRETFWVKAKAEKVGGREYFHLQSVVHTKRPNVSQFDRLLSDGSITLDHLIKRLPVGRGHEKGPLFKIEKPKIQELFYGLPANYVLAG